VYPACERGGNRGDDAVDRPALLEILGPDRVRELGIRYRATTPGESSDSALRVKVSGRRSGLRLPFIGQHSIGAMIRDDFAAGRTVLVDGWVLSVTEARQAALYSLRS
jgi:hypothetical protein